MGVVDSADSLALLHEVVDDDLLRDVLDCLLVDFVVEDFCCLDR